jgi:hypothetical protein
VQLRELEKQFDDLGVAVCFVVIGDRAKADEFCGKSGMASRCVPDPSKATYRAMGFEKYGWLGFVLAEPALKMRRQENRSAGFAQDWKNTKLSDAQQLPGAAFIDKDGIVRWYHAGTHPGDLPTMSEMLQAIRDLPRD